MHAQQQVIPFYEKLGFVKEGDIFEEAGIMHYKMTLRK
jgi:predicted GNAT family N-acyltransferase